MKLAVLSPLSQLIIRYGGENVLDGVGIDGPPAGWHGSGTVARRAIISSIKSKARDARDGGRGVSRGNGGICIADSVCTLAFGWRGRGDVIGTAGGGGGGG